MLLQHKSTNKQILIENFKRFLMIVEVYVEDFFDELSKKVENAWEQNCDKNRNIDYQFYWEEDEDENNEL